MAHPVYKDLVDNVQGYEVTNVDLVGADDITVELQLTFNNGVMLSVKAERDKVYGPIIQVDTRRIVSQRIIDDTARVVSTYPAPPPKTTTTTTTIQRNSKFCTDVDEIESLLNEANCKRPNDQFIGSVREQFNRTQRLTWNQVDALMNIVRNIRR